MKTGKRAAIMKLAALFPDAHSESDITNEAILPNSEQPIIE
jgi:hypothetical protein